MRKILIIFCVLGILIACSNTDDVSNIVVTGTFIHPIANCNNATNPEENCVEYIWFNDRSTANIMYGGADFGQEFSYTQNGGIIQFITNNEPFSFKIESASILIRVEDNEVWNKEE